MVLPPQVVHPVGEVEIPQKQALATAIEVETYAGKVHVEWDPTAAVTPIGQLAFFIELSLAWVWLSPAASKMIDSRRRGENSLRGIRQRLVPIPFQPRVVTTTVCS